MPLLLTCKWLCGLPLGIWCMSVMDIFLFTLSLHWPPQGLNHTWCIKSAAFIGRILMVEVCWILLFIVYWLQAWRSYAPRTGSMHILTQGRECVTIYSKSRKWVLYVRRGGSVLTYQWAFTWPTYLLTSLKRRHLVKTDSSSLSTLQLGNRLVSCAAVWPPCRENIKLS